jgi:hypothetical protein
MIYVKQNKCSQMLEQFRAQKATIYCTIGSYWRYPHLYISMEMRNIWMENIIINDERGSAAPEAAVCVVFPWTCGMLTRGDEGPNWVRRITPTVRQDWTSFALSSTQRRIHFIICLPAGQWPPRQDNTDFRSRWYAILCCDTNCTTRVPQRNSVKVWNK